MKAWLLGLLLPSKEKIVDFWERSRSRIFKGTAVAVLVFLIIVVWWYDSEAKAELLMEIAPTTLAGGDITSSSASLIGHERIAGKYDFGLIVLFSFNEGNENRGLQIVRTVQSPNGMFEAGLGYAFWANEQPESWNTDNTFALHLGWHVTDRFTMRWRHWSTYGTSSKNSGLDMLTFGYSFGKREH